MYFPVEEATVLALKDPVILIWPNYQLAGYAQPLQNAPVLQRLIKRYAKVVLANR